MPRIAVADLLGMLLVGLLGVLCVAVCVHSSAITWKEYWVLCAQIKSIETQQAKYPNLPVDCPHFHGQLMKDLETLATGTLVPAIWAGLGQNFGSVALQNIYGRASGNLLFEVLMPDNYIVRAIISVIAAIGMVSIVVVFLLAVAAVLVNRDRQSTYRSIKQTKAERNNTALGSLAARLAKAN